MSKTAIPWAQHTWNPMTGCTQCSPGCVNCYAKRLIETRLQHLPQYRNGFEPTFHLDLLEEPTKRKKPTLYFVNSMSDTFHEHFEAREIASIFATMRECQQHFFLVLTKRAGRMQYLLNTRPRPISSNVMVGVTVEEQEGIERLRILHDTNCSFRFASLEPLLGPIYLPPDHNLDWVIIGGESGSNARPCHSDWVRDLVEQCRDSKTPVFVKQAGWNPKGDGWDDLLKIREVPVFLKQFFPARVERCE